jgi:hypothetical protein
VALILIVAFLVLEYAPVAVEAWKHTADDEDDYGNELSVSANLGSRGGSVKVVADASHLKLSVGISKGGTSTRTAVRYGKWRVSKIKVRIYVYDDGKLVYYKRKTYKLKPYRGRKSVSINIPTGGDEIVVKATGYYKCIHMQKVSNPILPLVRTPVVIASSKISCRLDS